MPLREPLISAPPAQPPPQPRLQSLPLPAPAAHPLPTRRPARRHHSAPRHRPFASRALLRPRRKPAGKAVGAGEADPGYLSDVSSAETLNSARHAPYPLPPRRSANLSTPLQL